MLLAVRCGEEGVGFRLYGLGLVSADSCYAPLSHLSLSHLLYRVKLQVDWYTDSSYLSLTPIYHTE